ncbi:hypothetical protein KL905_002569 [Ogataea polymorpha]|nr:hypothetical protein KL937_002157 [Ogataea polymorpha]KAG7889392.1 hypothetical protein KL936_002966 [Ogataea polymorpha]KAG7894574.1 hypothetical protein KL908_001946 [Ogataea polymorpha]KAG7899833.1 hypothetical protein KL935_003374 [Ogataea polymorpha]KAG7906673.1 hypothetical protein KL907_002313 [Ogataea polymorpha]
MFVTRAIQGRITRFGVRYSAVSKRKRIAVQLLKDFPSIGVKGQIVQVKPSVMINRLHPYNGAVYMHLPDSKPRIPVVEPKEADLMSKRPEQQGTESQTLTLDDLISFDLNQLLVSERDAIIAKLPRRVLFRAEKSNNKLRNPISGSRVLMTLNRMVTQGLQQNEDPDQVNAFFADSRLKLDILDQEENRIDYIHEDGVYSAQLTDLRDGGKLVHRFTIGVNVN